MSSAAAKPIRSGSRQEAAGANTPIWNFGLAEPRIGACENEVPRPKSAQARRRGIARARPSAPDRRAEHAQDKAVETAKHRSALGQQMFLDAHAEREMRAFRVDQDAKQPGLAAMLRKRGVERAYSSRRRARSLGAVEPQAPRDAPSRSNQTLTDHSSCLLKG